jgi:murein L,D-transpeptidase YafK
MSDRPHARARSRRRPRRGARRRGPLAVLILASLFASIIMTPLLPGQSNPPASAGTDRAFTAAARVRPALERDLAAAGLHFGDPVFLRIFKEERELELWLRHRSDGSFRHFRTWPVVAMSGTLGPKLAEGDNQAPEGFYWVTPDRMKPDSRFHLAFNLGFPNAYDAAHGRTGSLIMVHGNQVSLGCFAMTDARIEEIYTLCAAALAAGQPFFRVHVFPFRMSAERLARTTNDPWHDFWRNLKEGYDWFQSHGLPPDAQVENRRYVFRPH